MKVLYLDLSMGVAGDMITSALLGLFDDPDAMCDELNSLGIPHVEYVLRRDSKCGIVGLHVSVEIDGVVEGADGNATETSGDDATENAGNGAVKIPGERNHHQDQARGHYHDHRHHHHHAKLADIECVIDALNIDYVTKAHACEIFKSIAEAESLVHGESIDQIHFHEVGTMDAVADVVAASYLLNKLSPDVVSASSICTGVGTVECAHGVLPVPAPATAILLKGIPAYGGNIEGELCTPTGAAIVKHFVRRFESMPQMRIDHVGYGIGTKDFPQANCLRAMLGESVEACGSVETCESVEACKTGESCGSAEPCESAESRDNAITGTASDDVVELVCNVDDMTGESLGYALERLLAAGALDAFVVPVVMKKSRPGNMLCVLCDRDSESDFAKMMLKLTTTLGVRRYECARYVLDREVSVRKTKYGDIRVKTASGYGVSRQKIEYEDAAKLAIEKGISLEESRKLIEKEL